ncbi:hypothetical protein [Salegentibacter sp. Hel_I_6]|uniref:hypothetical protein n=1 Tax=Salegentibacter sp. Hel_I_6 TaxID=1250278 RepID=UPI000562C9EF|nr:hypothetical protein [Salegentibacter sp. Hel_I_6]
MENFRLQRFLMLFLVVLIVSCSNDEKVIPDNLTNEHVAIVHLGAILNDFNDQQSRQSLEDIPDCSEEAPGFAQIVLTYGDEGTSVDIVIEILEDENGLFTVYDEALEIPIPSGETSVSVTLNEFFVWTNVDDEPGEIIWAAPKIGSDFADLVENPLPFTWNLRAGSKTYTNVDVLCFDDRLVNLYGYQFFDIAPKVIYELCFFANYCTNSGRHYTATYSLDIYYGTDANGAPLYTGEIPMTGEDGEFYADPLCLAIPGPQNDEAADEPYLYYVATLIDWEDNYGDANGQSVNGTLSWNEVQDLLNADGETNEYVHIFINCDEGATECGEFEAIPESSFYETIIPENPVDYFEIVTYLDEIIFNFSQGELCAGAEDMANCTNEFNNLIADDGFVISCLPAGCYTFIREQTDGVNQLITTDEELLEFLGNIDSKGDALLLALANDYYWSINDIENGAIKEACSGYELIASKIVSSCAPLQIDRFLLRITPSGQIIILDQEVIEFGENLCI